MQIISDLHIHSRFSQGCSRDLTIPNLEKYANMKGVNLLGTGDFTHPKWIKELKENLKEDETGILKTKTGFNFVLQTEISLIYTQGGKGRRIHNIVLAPNFESVNQITDELKRRGRVDYDGRPIFKIPCFEFVDMLKKISKDIEIIPAHIWTPWFGMLGSKSGFDSVKECFQEKTKEIHAMETGLSSDPEMNWRLSQLDDYNLVSFSDLHSYWPWRIGREATIFDIKLTYKNLIKAIREGVGLKETIEVNPSYGKYHLDGHRNCNVCLEPKESLRLKDICPKCGRKITIGVLHRVEELADRKEGFKPKSAKPFRHLIPLSECISGLLNTGVMTKKVWEIYSGLIKNFNNEMNVLLNVPKEELAKVVDEKIAEMIIKNREGKIDIKPGYDGEYGKPVFTKAEKEIKEGIVVKKEQKGLKEFY